jgi:hypothetical protein
MIAIEKGVEGQATRGGNSNGNAQQNKYEINLF